jgi:chromosome segregation ATPase
MKQLTLCQMVWHIPSEGTIHVERQDALACLHEGLENRTMENAAITDHRTHLDHGFLDAVEQEIERALQRVNELEAGLEHLVINSNSPWQAAFGQMNSSLKQWESHLDDLTRQTSTFEAELQEQESVLRDWFHALGTTTSKLSEVPALVATS